MNEAATVRGDQDPQVWFREHFDEAAGQVLAFLDGAGESPIESSRISDAATESSISAWCSRGLTEAGRLRHPPDHTDALLRAAAVAGVADALPEQLSFATSTADQVPSEDDAFDLVVTWSVFEHVARPVPMLNEINRVLKPDGVLFLQLWPFFFSEHVAIFGPTTKSLSASHPRGRRDP